jgi:hypothetical protein
MLGRCNNIIRIVDSSSWLERRRIELVYRHILGTECIAVGEGRIYRCNHCLVPSLLHSIGRVKGVKGLRLYYSILRHRHGRAARRAYIVRDVEWPWAHVCGVAMDVCLVYYSCGGAGTEFNPSSPGQILIRKSFNNETCCSYDADETRGTFFRRDGTIVYKNTSETEAEPCAGKDDAVCCKVGNGNSGSSKTEQYACFNSTDFDDTVPEGVPNDDNCVCPCSLSLSTMRE